MPKKGNYLTKKYQRKKNFNPYLYDNGFGDIFYICSSCDSNKLTPKALGGFQPPEWTCDNCGKKIYAPKYMSASEYPKYLKDKETRKIAMKFKLI